MSAAAGEGEVSGGEARTWAGRIGIGRAVSEVASGRRETWRFVFWAWASSRLLFLTVGALGAHLLTQVPAGYPADPGGALSYWGNWDGGWYAGIAHVGYFGLLWPSSANFFPFFPLLLRIGTTLGLGAAVTGVVISLVASALALYFLHEVARDYFDRDVARAATLALAFFPSAFYLNAVYTEAVFLAAAIGSVWAARLRGDFILAGVLGCIAAMTRNVGVFLLLPLGHEWLRRRRLGAAGSSGLALALVPAGLLGYMFWLWRWSGHPLLFSTVVKKTWGRTLTSPVHTLDRAWSAARDGAGTVVHVGRVFGTTSPDPSYHALGTIDFVVLLVVAALLVLALRRLPIGLSAYAVAVVLLPVLTPAQVLPLASFTRYAMAAFPIFIALAVVLRRNGLLLAGWLAVSATVGVLLTLYFTSWRWVG